MRLVYFALAVLACSLCLFVMTPPPVPVEPQVDAASIDFDNLHAQARTALETLQQSQERRLASAASSAF